MSEATMPPVIRAMRLEDVPAMLVVQRQCYPLDMNEPAEVFQARFQACPDTAWVVLDASGQVGAYLVAYRSLLGKVTPLGHAFEHAPGADALYLHDLAIGPSLRGQGLAQALVQHARTQGLASGLQALSLVSVNGTVPFWQRMGFELVCVVPESAQALQSYVQPALYMVSR
jgi:GNAT superfamily N-acetyltransferase